MITEGEIKLGWDAVSTKGSAHNDISEGPSELFQYGTKVQAVRAQYQHVIGCGLPSSKRRKMTLGKEGLFSLRQFLKQLVTLPEARRTGPSILTKILS